MQKNVVGSVRDINNFLCLFPLLQSRNRTRNMTKYVLENLGAPGKYLSCHGLDTVNEDGGSLTVSGVCMGATNNFEH